MPDRIQELLDSGRLARQEDRPQDAKRDLAEALALCRERPDSEQLPFALVSMGQIERDAGRVEEALQCYREAADIFRATDSLQRLAHALRHIADICREAGDCVSAEPPYREALNLYRRDARMSSLDLANALRGFALLQQQAGRADEARVLWLEAKALYAAVGIQVDL